jgi:serine protease Do
VYPAVQLTSNFLPDPHTLSVTAGGPVDVEYLGGSCVGFATSEPTFELDYTSGSQSLLRFYFVATLSRDSTMIINKPNGEYVCADDSFNTVHPSIDFDSPATGTYDVWIGAFVGGTDVAGTLSVTELADNHP